MSMRRLKDDDPTETPTRKGDPFAPVNMKIDGDAPIGLTADELAMLEELKAMALANPEKPEEEEEVSPATVHTMSRSRWGEVEVRVDKTAGTAIGVELSGHGVIVGSVEVTTVNQGSSLLGAVYEGDTIMSVNGTSVSDPAKAAALLTAAGGLVTIGVKRAEKNEGVNEEEGTAKAKPKASARYSLNSFWGTAEAQPDGATLLTAQ